MSGRSSVRGMPVISSMVSTRLTGTRPHWLMACDLIESFSASVFCPPTASIALSNAASRSFMVGRVSYAYGCVNNFLRGFFARAIA